MIHHRGLRPTLATLIVVAVFGFTACSTETGPMTREQLTDFVTRYAAAWSSQAPEALASFYAEDRSLTWTFGADGLILESKGSCDEAEYQRLMSDGGGGGSPAPEARERTMTRIRRAQLEEMFDSVRGKPGWSLDAEMVWDYFFTSEDPSVLVAAAPGLEAMGYEVVGILRPAPEDEDQRTLFLQVRRIEHHTVDSLLERNEKLYEFAEANGLLSYDGMDMSRVEPDGSE